MQPDCHQNKQEPYSTAIPFTKGFKKINTFLLHLPDRSRAALHKWSSVTQKDITTCITCSCNSYPRAQELVSRSSTCHSSCSKFCSIQPTASQGRCTQLQYMKVRVYFQANIPSQNRKPCFKARSHYPSLQRPSHGPHSLLRATEAQTSSLIPHK